MDSSMYDKQLNLIKRSLLAIEKLELQVKALKAARTTPVAVIGAACRFPGAANDPAAFWEILSDKKDAVIPLPDKRWDMEAFYDSCPNTPGKMYNDKGGFIYGVDEFDAGFFNISPVEAITMDPQQRLVLQTSWHALEDACIPPDSLKESQTGVFIGIGQNDYAYLLSRQPGPGCINPYFGSGNGHCFVAGRISYVLGLQGPSLAVDTACSSSLLATHLACQSLHAGECDTALAGGVQLMLSPLTSIYLSQTRALSLTNRCSSFSKAADGFVRSEGVGMVVLKRLDDALKDGDKILCVIKGSAANHDGNSSGITVPNGLAQQRLIRAAMKAAGVVSGSAIRFVEAHGTGTALGDPIELEALGNVYGSGQNPDMPLWVGSVKSNIGHLEAAAGVASLIKTSLVLQHKRIPPNLHFAEPNPLFNWSQYSLKVPVETTALASKEGPLLAGISGFGLSGSNVHIIVEEAPAAGGVGIDLPCQVFTISAKSPERLLTKIKETHRYLKSRPPQNLADVAYTVNAGRQHFAHRVAWVVTSPQALLEELEKIDTVQDIRLYQERLAALPPDPETAQLVEKSLSLLRWPAATGEKGELQCFHDLCVMYVASKPIDWRKLYAECNYKKLSFLLTPFEQQRYWIDMLVQPASPTGINHSANKKENVLERQNGHLHPDIQQTAGKDAHAPAQALPLFLDMPLPEARKELVQYLKKKIATLLVYAEGQLPDARQGFFEMGIDSIMAMQLKGQLEIQLQVQLPATIIFEFHTIDELSSYLLKTLRVAPSDAGPQAGKIVSPPAAMPVFRDRDARSSQVDALIGQLEHHLEIMQQDER